jgi:hypothetical protein
VSRAADIHGPAGDGRIVLVVNLTVENGRTGSDAYLDAIKRVQLRARDRPAIGSCMFR